jgi:hypothetical protein
LLNFLPAYDIIQRTTEHAKDQTPTQEEATIFLRLYGEEGVMPPTVEGIAGAFRVFYQERTAWWGSGPPSARLTPPPYARWRAW